MYTALYHTKGTLDLAAVDDDDDDDYADVGMFHLICNINIKAKL